MQRKRFILLLPTLLVLITGCSKNDPVSGDMEAPSIAFLLPAPGDTVGVDQVTLVVSATDNVGVARVEFFLNNSATPEQTVTSPPWQATISLAALNDGSHTVTARAYDDAGNTASAGPVTFVKGIRSADVVLRMVLVEIITSANCAPCGPANEAFRNHTNNAYYQERIAVIKYHVPIPRGSDSLWIASQEWSRPRKDYLFGAMPQSAPNAWVSGTFGSSVPTNWFTLLDQEIAKPADARIDLSKTVTGDRVTLTAVVKGIGTGSHADLRLHTVLTHSNIEYNDGNSELVHYEVMSQMLPNADGETITLGNAEEKTFTREFTIKPEWRREEMEAIVFLQNNESKYVLQSSKLSLK